MLLKPADTFGLLDEYSIYTVTFDGEPIIFRVNKSKIDFKKLSTLEFYEQKKLKITVECPIDLDIYRTSDFKESFEDFEIDLSKSIIFGPKIVR
jgi:hypothetical protein